VGGEGRDPIDPRGVEMSVAKVVEVTASSPTSFEDAVQTGIAKAGESLRNIKGAWIAEQKVDVENGKIAAYRVTLKISFLVE
jgi:flavin-binding protein dodecin